jgi:LacI family transcriptional regulator
MLRPPITNYETFQSHKLEQTQPVDKESWLNPDVRRSAVGIKDVAAAAGVSAGTVSNVLNHPEVVSDATRQRVQQAIATLGFVRNESGRQLRAGRSRMIAYLVLNASNPFFADVARGVDEVARAHGLALFTCDSSGDVAREAEYLELMVHHRVRGALVSPVGDETPALELMQRHGVPVVLVDRGAGTRGCSVVVDDVEGGVLAVTHLREQGHERIAFVGGPHSAVHVADRLAGSRRAIEASGLPADALVVIETAALHASEGRRAGEVLAGLPRARRPTAAFCANDVLALGLLQQMTQLGVAVPGELAIVGYDDIDFASAAAVPLSSVRQPRDLLGRTAAELLLAESEATETHEHHEVRFHPQLVVRASSVGAAGHRPAGDVKENSPEGTE